MSRQIIPFVDLKKQYRALEPQIQERMNRVLEHGQYIMGPEVRELEERLADYVGASHCISVSSGTEALLISLMALDISAGDQVITTPFTFIASMTLRPDRTSVYAQYTIMIEDRDAYQEKLKDTGIPTAVHYPIPLNEQPAYREYFKQGDTPHAALLSQKVMSLPMHPDLNADTQNEIVACVGTLKA